MIFQENRDVADGKFTILAVITIDDIGSVQVAADESSLEICVDSVDGVNPWLLFKTLGTVS